MPIYYRIVPEKHMEQILSGEGARLYGGRWNLVGDRVVYTSSSRSLACLEMLVHTDTNYIPENLYIGSIEIPDDLVQADFAPIETWASIPAQDKSMKFGSAWIESKKSACLAVPSVVIPQERNLLINPEHPDFSAIQVISIEKFDFDERFFDNKRDDG